MVPYSNRAKTCQQSEKDGAILKQCQNLLTVRKRWYNTQIEPKPVNSQKKMVQYSNRAKTCHQSEKDGTILKQWQNLSPARKRWYHTQIEPKPVSSQKKMVQDSNRAKTCQQSKKDVKYSNRAKTCQQWKKDGAILKQNKPVSSLKMMVKYSNKAKTCNRSEKDGDTEPKPVTSQKKVVYTQTKQPVASQKKMVQYSNRAKTCQLSEKVRTKLERSQNLIIVRKRWYNTPTGSKTVISKKNLKTPQYSNRTKWIHHVKREVAMSPTIYSPILQSYPAAAQKWMLVKKCPMLNCK